ncbi:cytochrome P450 [Mycobacterium lentiflavum]|uniref:cytochrome P450 n=1 Tax=Mycobacterium lentiflavum TaxID=141349 RepID=UPI000B86810F|nr:cytochrome P450 [Mycobacterium lentiflavum]
MDQFDHHSRDFAQHWRGLYADMRQHCPVTHSDRHDGFSVLTRYDDIKKVLADPETFVSGRDLSFGDDVVRGGATVPTNPVRMGMMEMDPPVSQAYRKLLAPLLSRKAIDAYRPRMQEIVSWTIDRVIGSGSVDFVDQIANPLPAMVSLDYFGLSLDKWEQYATTLHKAVYREKGSARDLVALVEDVRATVVERRATAGERGDLVDALLTGEVNGEPLDDEMVTELLFMLLNGGIDTSTALIAHMFGYLGEHPGDRDTLIADPDRIPSAIDEMLRYFPPGTGVARTVAKPVEIQGHRFTPGDRVYCAIGGANLDPDIFVHPDEVLLNRENSGKHLSFGFGVHRCLGSFLAPMELTVLLGEVLHRMPDYVIDRGQVRQYPTIPLVNGYLAMPATFTPGPRVLTGFATALPVRLEPATTASAGA